jgi:hypothetical protein
MSGTASSNTSATGGYVIDRPPGPLKASEIETVLQSMVATLANLPGHLVRPRWQPHPATQPPADVTWAAVGVLRQEVDDYPEIRHDGYTTLPGAQGPGVDRMYRHSTLTVHVTFYGPEAEDAAAQLRDASYIPQQMEMLRGLKLKTVHDLARAPELVNQQWINRADLEMEFRLQIDRVYPILNLNGADVVLRNDLGLAPTVVTVRPDTIIHDPGAAP